VTVWSATLWPQFGAAIDMLENAMNACPEDHWGEGEPGRQFWYMAYHALFYLDLYLSGSVAGFRPPAPFTLSELDPAGVLPDRTYSQPELRVYLAHCRDKCRTTLAQMTDETAARRCVFPWLDLDMGELQLYNMRHVQHHAAQLNLILRQRTNSAPPWVQRTRIDRGA
jgi:hypothetical protein